MHAARQAVGSSCPRVPSVFALPSGNISRARGSECVLSLSLSAIRLSISCRLLWFNLAREKKTRQESKLPGVGAETHQWAEAPAAAGHSAERRKTESSPLGTSELFRPCLLARRRNVLILLMFKIRRTIHDILRNISPVSEPGPSSVSAHRRVYLKAFSNTRLVSGVHISTFLSLPEVWLNKPCCLCAALPASRRFLRALHLPLCPLSDSGVITIVKQTPADPPSSAVILPGACGALKDGPSSSLY